MDENAEMCRRIYERCKEIGLKDIDLAHELGYNFLISAHRKVINDE